VEPSGRPAERRLGVPIRIVEEIKILGGGKKKATVKHYKILLEISWSMRKKTTRLSFHTPRLDGFQGESFNKGMCAAKGHGIAQMVQTLHKAEGRGCDSRWCHRNLSLI